MMPRPSALTVATSEAASIFTSSAVRPALSDAISCVKVERCALVRFVAPCTAIANASSVLTRTAIRASSAAFQASIPAFLPGFGINTAADTPSAAIHRSALVVIVGHLVRVGDLGVEVRHLLVHAAELAVHGRQVGGDVIGRGGGRRRRGGRRRAGLLRRAGAGWLKLRVPACPPGASGQRQHGG